MIWIVFLFLIWNLTPCSAQQQPWENLNPCLNGAPPDIHCSQMCVPFEQNLPAALAPRRSDCIRFEAFPIPSLNTHLQFNIFHNPNRDNFPTECPDDLFLLYKFAVQAVDDDGYPVGRWKPNTAGTSPLDEFCLLNTSLMYPQFPQYPVSESLHIDSRNLPIIEERDCTMTTSLRNRVLKVGNKITYLYFDQTERPNVKPINGFSGIWFYNGPLAATVPFTVTFRIEWVTDHDASLGIPFATSDVKYANGINSWGYKYSSLPFSMNPDTRLSDCFLGWTGKPSYQDVPVAQRTFQAPIKDDTHYKANPIYLQEIANMFPYVPSPSRPPTPSTPSTLQKTTKRATIKPIRPIVPIIRPSRTTEHSTITDQTPSPGEAHNKIEQIYRKCEVTKRCFGARFAEETISGSSEWIPGELKSRHSCIRTKTCDMIMSFGENSIGLSDEEIYIEVAGNSQYWLALGVSNDDRMGEDFVVDCSKIFGEVMMMPSWNTKKNILLGPKDDRNRKKGDDIYKQFIRPIETGSMGATMFCKFVIQKSLVFENPQEGIGRASFDLGRHVYFILMAAGIEEMNAGNYTYHGEQIVATKIRIALSARFSPRPYQQTLIYLHGVVMFFVFLFILPVSNFIVRYYKETFTSDSYFGYKQWSMWHTFLNLTGLFLIIIAHFMLTFANADWTRVGEHSTSYHLWTALGASALYLFNMFIGFINRKRPRGEKCDPFDWTHSILGHLSYLVGLVTLFNAPQIAYSFLPCWTYTVVITWFCVYFLFNLVMSYHYCWIDWINEKNKSRVWAMGPMAILVQPNSDIVAPGKYVRVYVLWIYMGTAGFFTLISFLLVAMSNEKRACYPIETFLELDN